MLPEPTEYLAPDERDQEIFAATVHENHYLRRVKAVIDFERSRDQLAACYCAALGRPAKEPILLLKLEFLQFHYNLSDRRVIEQARCNMAFRYFLDLSLRSALPHPTSLTNFRNRLGVDKHRAVFEDIVAQARECGLVKDRLRLKDATHVLANIAIPSTIRLVSQTREKLLTALRPFAPERVSAEEQQADTVRAATADLSGEERLLQRVNHLRAIVAWAEVLVGEWGPAPPEEEAQRQALRQAVALTHRVLADREKAKRKRKRGRSKKDKKDLLVSLQDPDARWGKHGHAYAGCLLDVTVDADSDIITAINVLPANGDEPADTTTLIRQEQEAHGNQVEAVSLDGVGFRGPLLRELTDPEGLNLEVIVPPTPEPESAYFTAKDFTVDAATGTLTCPAGHTTAQRQRSPNDTGWAFRFRRQQCQDCPLQAQCVQELPKTTGRVVMINDYQAEYDAARAKAQTPEFQEKRRCHWRVERKLGELVRWHRGRLARYRGCCKVLIQELLTALVVNVKCVVHWALAQTVRAEVAATN
jgi:transposase